MCTDVSEPKKQTPWRNATLFSGWKDDAGLDSKKEDKTQKLERREAACILLLHSKPCVLNCNIYKTGSQYN